MAFGAKVIVACVAAPPPESYHRTKPIKMPMYKHTQFYLLAVVWDIFFSKCPMAVSIIMSKTLTFVFRYRATLAIFDGFAVIFRDDGLTHTHVWDGCCRRIVWCCVVGDICRIH